jgi:hypothetical protein
LHATRPLFLPPLVELGPQHYCWCGARVSLPAVRPSIPERSLSRGLISTASTSVCCGSKRKLSDDGAYGRHFSLLKALRWNPMHSAARRIGNGEVPSDFGSLMACLYLTLSDGVLQVCPELRVPFAVSVRTPRRRRLASLLAVCLWLPLLPPLPLSK